MQHIMSPAEQWRDLFPYPALEERKANGAMTNIVMGRQAVNLLWRDDLILIIPVNLAKGAQKTSGVAS